MFDPILLNDPEVLDKRLDDRVDDMMSRGLLKELEEFHKEYNQRRIQGESPSYTQGIFQSIGLKEFHTYLTQEDKSCPKAELLLQEGLDALKIATRRYARRQIKWIRGRFLRSVDRPVPPVYALDATDPSMWDEKVYNPAESIVKSILGTGPPPEQQPLPKEKVSSIKNLKGERLCRVCMRIFIGDHQWEIHQKSKKHHAMLRKKKKQEDQKLVNKITTC
nr:tRNA dimethylallyltransferase [Halyomorpha halys]